MIIVTNRYSIFSILARIVDAMLAPTVFVAPNRLHGISGNIALDESLHRPGMFITVLTAG